MMMVAGTKRAMTGFGDSRYVSVGVHLPARRRCVQRPSSGGFSGGLASRLASLSGIRATLMLILVALAPVGAAAMDMPAACRGENAQAAHLVSIVDATTFTLDDGRTVRLAGVGHPVVPLVRLGAQDGAHTVGDMAAEPVTVALDVAEDGAKGVSDPAAMASGWSATVDLQPGQALSLFAVSPKPDRWGRFSARVGVVQSGAGEPVSWLAGELVARGQAYVMPQDGATACHDALYGLEIAARAARRGLWAEPANGVWQADDPALARDGVGAWRIVSGRVLSVGVTQYNHYLNFGRDWNSDFTVTVRTKDVERFAAAGRHPAGLEGRMVRVRGWLRAWNGAVIDMRWPGEIEVVDGRD